MHRLASVLIFGVLLAGSVQAADEKERVRSPITVHVLDSSRGKPAVGLTAVLEQAKGDGWQKIAEGQTDANGRLDKLLPADKAVAAGVYRIRLESGAYFAASKTKTFYPYIVIVFEIENPKDHRHIPLILSPFGYTTYRGN
jgi:5-hydroxyisourate hydrolase